MVERRIKAAKFPAPKSLDSFDFKAIPALNKARVLDLARCGWIERRENVIALGPSDMGKTHIALGLGLAACQKGLPVRFTTAAALVHELKRFSVNLNQIERKASPHCIAVAALTKTDAGPQAANHPSRDIAAQYPVGQRTNWALSLSKIGAELLFELIAQRYERSSTLITSNLPCEEWIETLGSERLTGALLDRLTHHVSILEMNGESYRLAQSRKATRNK